MRQLNKKQKKMIDKWFDNNWTGPGSISDIHDMSVDLITRIEDINDHEAIVHNMNRYINDKAVAKRIVDKSVW